MSGSNLAHKATGTDPERFEEPPYVLAMVDHEDRVVEWSAEAEALFLNESADILGCRLADTLIRAQDRPAYHREVAELFEVEPSTRWQRFESNAALTDGRTIPLDLMAVRLQTEGADRVVLFMQDRTVRERRERLLQSSVNHHQRLLRSVGSIVVSVDLDGQVVEWNRAAEQAFGLDIWDAIGQPLASLPLTWEFSRLAPALERAHQSPQPQRVDDVPFRRVSGEPGVLGLTLTPVRGDDDEHHGILILGADVTQRRELEARLLQSQHLESIGRLAAGIAHEINTPTQFVGDNIRFLQDSLRDLMGLLEAYQAGCEAPDHERPACIARIKEMREVVELDYLRVEVPKAIQQSLEGMARVASIVRAMKDFSHPSRDRKSHADVNEAIRSTAVVARAEYRYVAELHLELDPELPVVPCLLAEFNQVMLNLIVNAAHAIEDARGPDEDEPKGTITVRTRLEDDQAVIEVIDDGIGMDEDTCARVFDPFFTTKEVGRGTGQGLALAHDVVVNKHRGALAVTSEPGKGSRFRISLPIHTSVAVEPDAPDFNEAVTTGSG